jgi:hypothetical protein
MTDSIEALVDSVSDYFYDLSDWFNPLRDIERREVNCYDNEYKCPARCKEVRLCGYNTCWRFGVPYPCNWSCDPWELEQLIRNKACIAESIELARMMQVDVLLAKDDVDIVHENNENNVKGLRYAADNKESLGRVIAGFDSIPISTVSGGATRKLQTRFPAKGIGLPILRPDSKTPKRENVDLASSLEFDFNKYEPDGKAAMETELKEKLAGPASNALLRDTRLQGTKFSDFGPHTPPTLRFRAEPFARTKSTRWASCSQGQESFGIQEAWEYGEIVIVDKVKQWILATYELDVWVQNSLSDRSYTYYWITVSTVYGCRSFDVSLELQVKDSGDRLSEPLRFSVSIPYGTPVLEQVEASAMKESTICHDEPIDELYLQRYGLAAPDIVRVNCPSPYLDIEYHDTRTPGVICTSAYDTIQRDWSLVSTNPSCGLPPGSESAILKQEIILGGRHHYFMRMERRDQIPETATNEEVTAIYMAMVENGTAMFGAAAPYFSLQDVSFYLPNEVNPTVPVQDSDFYLVAPYPECGLCEAVGNGIIFSHPQDFDCSEVGTHEITITALNNIGISFTDSAIATVLDVFPPTITCPPDVTAPAKKPVLTLPESPQSWTTVKFPASRSRIPPSPLVFAKMLCLSVFGSPPIRREIP